MSHGQELREAAISAERGMAKIQMGGWSIVMTGGPNDRIGNLNVPPVWQLSGKRLDGRRPTPLQLDFLERVSKNAGGPGGAPVELIAGTWHWAWHEIDGIPFVHPPNAGLCLHCSMKGS